MIKRVIELEMSYNERVLIFNKLKQMFKQYRIPITNYEKYKSITIGFDNKNQADSFIMKFYDNLKNSYKTELLYA